MSRIFASLLVGFVLTPTAPAFAHEKATGGVESLDVYQDGPVINLLLGEMKGKARWLSFQRSADGGKTWTKAVRVQAKGMGPVGAFARGSDAQIASSGNTVLAVWTGTGSKWGTGPLTTAVSTDQGETWTSAPTAADGTAPEGQSYIDVAVDAEGRFHAVWLDGRDGLQGLRTASAADLAKGWSPTETLMKGTCECCWNAIHASKAGGLHVLYREKDPRDMAIMAKAPGQTTWQRQATVGAFGWKFEGCPHVGGALASAGKTPDEALHALVWTGMTGKAGLYYLRSDAGKWSEPQRVGSESAKHADLAVNGDRVAAVWDAVENGKRVVLASTTADGGKTWSAPVTLSKPGEHASHPRVVAAADGGFAAFWTATAKGPAGLRQTRF